MEHIQGINLLSGRYELDRFSDYSLDGKGCTTSGITIHLGQYNSVEIKHIVESLSGFYGVLTCHRIDHEENLSRIYCFLDGSDLIHHFLVYCETTCGIDNNYGNS